MQIVPKLPIVSLRRRTNRVAIQETPILAFLGLGLFLWIFLTNSLPAKRDLAHRLAQVELHAGEQGRLALLREELNREECLGEAIRDDSVVRQTLLLFEHPTAKPNDPARLILPLSLEFFPDEPDPIVEDADYEDALSAPEELPRNAPAIDASESDAPSTRPLGGSNSGVSNRRVSTSNDSGANDSGANDSGANNAPTNRQPPKTPTANPRPHAPESTKRLATPPPESRTPQSRAETRAALRPATTPHARKKPTAPGHFEVPNFLQG